MEGLEEMSARVLRTESAYSGYVSISKATLEEAGQKVVREIVHQGNAVAVLPYDPDRKLCMLVQLLRAPVLLCGVSNRLLEVPAGVIDAGESPLEAARREVLEETGLSLMQLDQVAGVWSSPGVSTEQVFLFLAPYNERDKIAAGGGLAEEHENITMVERPLFEVASLVGDGELSDMKTLTLLLALQLRRPELF